MNQEQWKQIEEAATQLGVGGWALKKWKQRGIPYKWHVPLSDKTGIKLRDMFADRMARND